MGASAKIAISMDLELLDRLDCAARERKVSRSGFIREAVEAALVAAREREIQDSLNAIYSDPQTIDDQRESSELLLGASSVNDESVDDRW